jgi:hypothetical protein
MAHLPELIRHENITTARGRWFVFSSPYYRDVKSSDTSAWKLMKKIILWHSEYKVEYYRDYTHEADDIYSMQAFVHFVKDDMPKSIINALQEIVNVASNCGPVIGFDLKKNNFGVNEYGTLIFRDPIYVRE